MLPALKILERNEKIPPGYNFIDLMIIFDVKMDLTRKALICARGDQTDSPSSATYASVVTKESIRLGFMLASLNYLNLLSADVAGAYLNAPCAEYAYPADFNPYKAIFMIAVRPAKSPNSSPRTM